MTFEEKYKATYVEEELPQQLSEKYRIVSCLKHNENKQIYLIKDITLGTEYILKCANGVYLPQLRKEYKILGKAGEVIRCPKPISYIEVNDTGYLIREYIKGETIKELVEKECFSEAKTFEAVGTICESLKKLHLLDPPVIMRDIKPENLILSNGEYIIIDFDAAREWNEKVTSDTEYIGTRVTAAPEQFGYSQTDKRTDVYAVGMLMTYMLTGGYDTSAVSGGKSVKIVRKCTQFSPDKRYKSTQAICAAMKSKGLIFTGASVAVLVLAAAVFFTIKALNSPAKSNYVMSPTNTFTFTEQADEYSDRMVADALACIDRQNDTKVRAGKTKAEMVDYLLKDSRYAVFGGEEWPALATKDESYFIQYVNDSNLEPIDGTHAIKLDSLSSASMSVGWFVSGAIYTEEISLESFRVYPDGTAGKYDANTLKNYFGTYLQAGEHIRIDETRSMSFISCNDIGFYFIEYGSDDNTDRYTRLRYYTFEDFVNYLNPLDKNIWYYEVDQSTN